MSSSGTLEPTDIPALFAASSAGVESDGLAPARPADIAASWVQRVAGWLFLLPFAGFLVFLMRVWRGYRIEELTALRRRYEELTRERTPLIVCANHLTFIDSAIMIWAFGSNVRYLFRWRSFSWNLPAGDFFKKKFHFRVVAFLTKCLFIHRDGSREHKNAVLSLCRYWLRRGDVVSLFPEGRRSRTGRFDADRLTFGVGKLLLSTPGCRVLCVYLRGDRQSTFSSYPPRGSRFRVLTKLVVPATAAVGREAYRELAGQVGGAIAELEREYVDRFGPWPAAPPRPVALVTGASSGIGLAVARELAGKGYDLAVVARDEERLAAAAEELRRRFGSRVVVIARDLALPGAVGAVAERLRAEEMVVDTLVNNAGFAVHGRFEETPVEKELELVMTQLAATIELTKSVLPSMLARGRGNILNVASVYAYSPVPKQAVYAASKSFLLSFSESLAAETRGRGVRVLTVCPGVTRTEFRRRAGLPEKKSGGQSAEEVARFALAALKGNDTVAVPGAANRLFVAVARELSGRQMTRVMERINAVRFSGQT